MFRTLFIKIENFARDVIRPEALESKVKRTTPGSKSDSDFDTAKISDFTALVYKPIFFELALAVFSDFKGDDRQGLNLVKASSYLLIYFQNYLYVQ